MSIKVYQDYFTKLLKNTGVKVVYTTLKEVLNNSSTRYGAIYPTAENLETSQTKILITNNQNQQVKRIEKFKRNISLTLIIGDSDFTKVESIYSQILSEISHRITLENGRYSTLTITDIVWIDKEDTVLKSNITLEIKVVITESIFNDYEFKQISIGGDGEYVKS